MFGFIHKWIKKTFESCHKNDFAISLYTESGHFTKTGSGHAQGRAPQKDRFRAGNSRARAARRRARGTFHARRRHAAVAGTRTERRWRRRRWWACGSIGIAVAVGCSGAARRTGAFAPASCGVRHAAAADAPRVIVDGSGGGGGAGRGTHAGGARLTGVTRRLFLLFFFFFFFLLFFLFFFLLFFFFFFFLFFLFFFFLFFFLLLFLLLFVFFFSVFLLQNKTTIYQDRSGTDARGKLLT